MPSGLAEAYPSIKDLLQIASAMLQLELIRPIPGGKSRASSRFAAKATACPGESAKAMIDGEGKGDREGKGDSHEWHSVKPNTLGLKVLRTKTPARLPMI